MVAARRSPYTLGRNRLRLRGLDQPYLFGYNAFVFQIQQTEAFAKWFVNLRDVRAKARILARLDSVRLGNMGDAKSVGGGVSEMRIDVGAGYRVFYTRRQRVTLILLCGGDKSTQAKDIANAKLMVQEIE